MFCHFFNLHFSHHQRINSQPMIDELQWQAKALHQAGKTNNAAALHQQVLALDVKNTQPLTYISLWHHAFGMAAEAITTLEQVVTIQTNAVFVHGKLGACYQMLDQWQQAVDSEVGLRPYVRGSKGAGDWSNLADSLQWSSLHLYENGRAKARRYSVTHKQLSH
jgi:copper homeostasis protein CutC